MDEFNENQKISAGNERLMGPDLAPIQEADLAPQHGIEQGEFDPDDLAPIQEADLAPQHGIEQGEFDPDDLTPPGRTPPWMDALVQTPPGRTPPRMDALVQRPPGRTPPWMDALMQTPPWMDALVQTPPGRTPPWMDALVQTPPERTPPWMDALVQTPPGVTPPWMDALVLEIEREREESNLAPIQGADLTPQDDIEQGEFDPDLVQNQNISNAITRRRMILDEWRAWGRITSIRNERLTRLDQILRATRSYGLERLMRYNQARGRVNGVEQNDSTQRSFMAYVDESLRNLSTKQLTSYLGIFSVALGGLTRYSTTQFDPLQVIKTRYTAEEAFRAYYPEVIHMTIFTIFFTIIFIMVLQLQLRHQVFMGALLTFSTVFYLAMLGLNASASGVYVSCGSLFELPLFSFASLEAAGFSVIIGLVIFLISYLGWRFVHKGNPRAVEVSLDGLLPL